MEVEWTVGPIPINDDLGVCSAPYLVGCESLLASTGRQSVNKIACVPMLQTY